MKIKDLTPDSKNANNGTERGRQMLEDSLQWYGAGRSILVDKHGNVIAGNKTLEMAASIGLEDVKVVQTDGNEIVAVQRTDLDLYEDDTARELAYADNRVAQVDLDFNPDQILEDLNNGIDLTHMWTDAELNKIVEKPPLDDAGADVDRAEELNEQWGVKTGDIWQIGHHRLMCGDSRQEWTWEGDIVFTSPPYNMGDNAKLHGNTHLEKNKYGNGYNDKQEQDYYKTPLNTILANAIDKTQYVFINLQMLAGNKTALIDWQAENKSYFCDLLVWDKGHAAPAMAPKVTNSRFELVYVFGKEASRAIGTKDFRGTVSNVYDGNPQRKNENADVHGATMPVDFPEWVVENFTNHNEVVIDPFCGTGTTIIACENKGRKCYGIEIDPKYCAVTLERLKNNGLQPNRLNTVK